MSEPMQIQVQVPLQTDIKKAELTFYKSECVVRLSGSEFIEKPQQITMKRLTNGGLSIAVGNRQGMVADYMPRPLWLTLDKLKATLFDAKMRIDEGKDWFAERRQYYTGARLIYGAHLQTDEEPVSSIRFVLNAKIQKNWFGQRESKFSTGKVRPWVREDGILGIEVALDDPLGISEMTRRTLTPIRALVSLWTHRDVSYGQVEYKSPIHGWLKFHDFDLPNPPKMDQTWLLPLSELSVTTLSQWLDVASKLGPIADMALHRTGNLQVDALVTATGLEGCHRRLVRSLKQPLAYRIRVKELAESVEAIVPGLLGPDLEEWATAVRTIRNEQGHVFAIVDNFDEAHISRYYVHHRGADWVLRLFLLLQVVDESVLSKGIKDCDKFWFTLANIDREHFWPGFSAYESFRQSVVQGSSKA